MPTKKELDCQPVSFIGAYHLDDRSVCDDLVALFEAHPEAHLRGTVNTSDGGSSVNSEVKDSVEMIFYPNSPAMPFIRYLQELQKCIKEYIAEYAYCDAYAPWTIVEGTNLQYYPPGAGYKVWHTERINAANVIASRHLAFMTYLNDITDGGQTEFFYQKALVQPEKGLTLIWPVDWTHTHRGVVSNTQEKYVITGWLNFVS